MTATLTRVLLVEDNPSDAVLLEEMLVGTSGGPFRLSRADRMASALDLLRQQEFEAILLDLTLPDSQGLETLQSARNAAKSVPIIVLTGVEDESIAIGAIRNGAQDYLVKGTVDGRAIARAIRYAIDRQKTEEALRRSDAAYAAAKVSVDTVNAMEEGVALITMNGIVSSVNPALVRMTGLTKEKMEGSRFIDLLPGLVDQEDLPLIHTAMAAALRGVIPELRETTILSNPVSSIPVIPRMAFIRDAAGSPTTIVLTVQDITAHKEAERRDRILSTVLALFAKKTSRKEYLDAVTKVVRQWSGCRCVGIRVLNDKGRAPYESHIGFPDKFIESETVLQIGQDQCACSRVIARQPDSQDMPCLTNGGSFWCDNSIKFMDRLSPAHRGLFRGICADNGFTSLSIIPVRYHNITVGALHFADERERAMSLEMVTFIEATLAPIIGEAIHRFNVETELRSLSLRLTLAEERARRQLAVALHDTVGQSLALGKIKLGQLGATLKDKQHLKTLAEIRDMFESAVQQTRTLSFELSPPILYELGLGAAIEWLGEDFAKRHGFRVHCRGTSDELVLNEPASVLFFQAARELLTNVTKHACAADVNISIEIASGQLVMTIADNGKGMEPNALDKTIASKKSLGLFSIRERLKQIGGSFVLQSEPGRGTTVILTAPIQDLPADDSEAEAMDQD